MTVLSLYKDNPLDATTYQAGKKLLKQTYKNFDDDLSLILLDQLKEQGFTNKRFVDAVKFVINNHVYQSIKPADILSFDKALHLRLYHEIAEEQKSFGSSIWEFYDKVDIKGTCYFIHKHELRNYGVTLPPYQPKPATQKINKKTDPGSSHYLSKDYSFKAGFNQFVDKTGIGSKISEDEKDEI
jgi:hypothetical protein